MQIHKQSATSSVPRIRGPQLKREKSELSNRQSFTSSKRTERSKVNIIPINIEKMSKYVRNCERFKDQVKSSKRVGFCFANQKEKEKAERLCNQMFSDKSIPNPSLQDLPDFSTRIRLQNKITYFYKPYMKKGDTGVPVLIKFDKFGLTSKDGINNRNDLNGTECSADAKHKWWQVSREVLSKNSEKFRKFLKSCKMTIDSYANWNGDEYTDKNIEETYDFLNPQLQSKKSIKSLSNRSSQGLTRSAIKKNKSPKKKQIRYSLNINQERSNWQEVESLNTKTCSTRKSSCEEIMPFFPFSTLMNSSDIKQSYSKVIMNPNCFTSHAKELIGKVARIRDIKESKRRCLSLYSQSTKKVKELHHPFAPIWFKNYSSKSIDWSKRKLNLSTKGVCVSAFVSKARRSKRTIDNSICELEDSILSVSEEEI